MLHAPDYGQLNIDNLKMTLNYRKKKDKHIETSMLYVTLNFHKSFQMSNHV